MRYIAKWNETFESADTRKRQRLGWLSIPTGNDSAGYIELMSHGERGVRAFGVFLAICQWSATQRQETRGQLARSDGRPVNDRQIAAIIRIPTDIVTDAIELLSSPEIAWICEKTEQNQQSATDLPVACHQSASDLPALCKEKEKEKEKYKEREKEKDIDFFSADNGVIVPKKMQTPEVHTALNHWLQHLMEEAPEKAFRVDSPQMQALWHKWSALGPERLVAAIWHSSSEKFITLHEPPTERLVGASGGKSKLRTPLDSIDWGDEHESN